jgi:hypothetical protein
MAKGIASPTSSGSGSDVNTPALPLLVRALETDLMAILLIEQDSNGKKHSKPKKTRPVGFILLYLQINNKD